MQLSDLDYLKLNAWQKFWYGFGRFFALLPKRLLNILIAIPRGIWTGLKAIGRDVMRFVNIFIKGDWKTRLSFLIMGFGQLFRGQILRGLLFLLFEAVFIFFMLGFGWQYLGAMGTLGTAATTTTLNAAGLEVTTYGDNSQLILLYGVLTICFVAAFIWTWRLSVLQNGKAQELWDKGIRPKGAKDDLKSLADEQYYKTLLALPLLGILFFTVVPIIFMILVGFTNYDYYHLPPSKLFGWVGMQNFNEILGIGSTTGKFGYTFGQILLWTLIWAFFATFTNYFLGMFVAMAINKKGIKFKKGFRTILVMTIAVPQFISLLLVGKMFSDDGIINKLLQNWGVISLLQNWGWIDTGYIKFLTDPTLARIMVIIINLWVGIPYLMLIATGILMNIPADLYESARIDGASGFKMFARITLPYMLFVTGPYLLTSFIANINNFNVIYLLTQGAPKTAAFDGGAGYTDLLITWLYRLTVTDNNYKMAAVIGLAVFIVTAVISLIVYNVSPSVKNEEDFQ